MPERPVIDCDALVIGGGITGCFIALRLAQKGQRVCLAEKNHLFRAASGRSGGGVRQQFRQAPELPLAMAAVQIWPHLARELHTDIEYYQGGSLRLHRTRQAYEEDALRVAREQSQGLDVRLLTPAEVRARLPILAPGLELWGGTFCPSDGTANPLRLGGALTQALNRAGVRVVCKEEITTLEVANRHIQGASGVLYAYRCSAVINAGGPWARRLMQTLHLDLPITARKSQILVTEPREPILREFVSFDKGYLRQARDGNFHLGVRGIPISEPETSQTCSSFTDVGQNFPEVFPFLARTQVIRGFAGITTWTADGLPILDRAPGITGLWVATGFSGHGFCLGPVIGRLFSEWVVEGRPGLDVTAFAWSRFCASPPSG